MRQFFTFLFLTVFALNGAFAQCIPSPTADFVNFSASDGNPETLSVNGSTNDGVVLDVLRLDNSFNIELNGTPLSSAEIQFKKNIRTVEFADGTYYGDGTIANVWSLTWTQTANSETPLIRFIANDDGTVSIQGSKTLNGPLEDMVPVNGLTFNAFTWNANSANIAVANQLVDGPTFITANLYGYVNQGCPEVVGMEETFAAVNGATGGILPTSILDSDTFNGFPATSSNVNLTVNSILDGTGTDASANISVDVDGNVSVAASTPAGTYTIAYTICDPLNPTYCSSVSETIVVEAPVVEAIEEAFDPVDASSGGTLPISILDSDKCDGNQATTTTITLAINTIKDEFGADASLHISVDANGFVTVVPGAPAGEYDIEYTICDKINPGNCATTVERISVTAPLPVELIYFNVVHDECTNYLTWETASEENNSHFVIEYSTNGLTFKTLDKVLGEGFSTTNIKYSYTHQDLNLNAYFYRLKQVDFNEKYEYSDILYLAGNCADSYSFSKTDVYPNPTVNFVNARIVNNSSSDKEVTVTLIDNLGRVVAQYQNTLIPGENVERVEMRDLAAGMYHISVDFGNGDRETVSIMKR